MDENYLWWRDGVIYQIYPRSFADSNNDGLGDLNGITSRLAYLSDFGIDAIWLSPIYPSPDVDFGYDVSDYTHIDPRFGTMADFERLVAEAHRRNIRVILDLVLNHTSDQHAWFQESRRGRDNPYSDWYLWREAGRGGKRPNNWGSVFGGSGWEWDDSRRQYYYHMFYKQQPDVNWHNPAVRKAMLEVFRFWLERDVDGFRLDVFNVYFKDAEFRNNPPKLGIRGFDRQHHVYDCDQSEMLPLLEEMRAVVDTYPQRYLVGETFLSTPERAAQYCGSNLLHAAFNFEFTHSRWNASAFYNAIQQWEDRLAADILPNYVLNNHDVRRSASRYGRGENDDRLKVAAALLLTLRGTPFLYYGEEIGMRDIKLSRSEIKDPIGRRYWPLHKGRDGCRSPMQWDDTANAGFCTVEPWLPVHPNYNRRNLEMQRADADSLFNFYRRLIQLRRSVPALGRGIFLPLTQEPRLILAYLRKTEEQTVLVALNFSRRKLPLILGGRLGQASWELLLSNKRDRLEPISGGALPLAPNEALVLLQR